VLLLGLPATAAPGQVRPGLPVVEAEACSIEFTSEAINQARWGGQIAIYDASTNAAGTVTTLRRRIIEGREHLPGWVRLDQFESCIRRWRFPDRGDYSIALRGGTVYGPVWIIEVAQAERLFRLRVPYRYRTPTG